MRSSIESSPASSPTAPMRLPSAASARVARSSNAAAVSPAAAPVACVDDVRSSAAVAAAALLSAISPVDSAAPSRLAVVSGGTGWTGGGTAVAVAIIVSICSAVHPVAAWMTALRCSIAAVVESSSASAGSAARPCSSENALPSVSEVSPAALFTSVLIASSMPEIPLTSSLFSSSPSVESCFDPSSATSNSASPNA